MSRGLRDASKSGEVLNATMAEVFLVLGFLLLVIATQYARDQRRAEEKLDSYQQEAAVLPFVSAGTLAERVGAMVDELRWARTARVEAEVARDFQTERALTAEAEAHRLREKLLRVAPPICKGYNTKANFARIEFLRPELIKVTVLRPYPSLRKVTGGLFTVAEFRSHYSPLWRQVRADKCRLTVRVVDNPRVPKEAYKRLNVAVQKYFYSAGHFE